MKNLVIILMLAFCCNCLADNNQPAHVIITAGQSNTDGRVPNDRLPDYIKAMSTDTAFTTGAYKYPRTAQTGSSVLSGRRAKEEPSPTHGDMTPSPTIGWSNYGKTLFTLSNGLSEALLSNRPPVRTSRFTGRQIPNGYPATWQPAKRDVPYCFLLSMT